MKIIRLFIISLLSLASVYLLLPTPGFPPPPPNALISTEPADTESIYRQAYYTNITREQIIDHYLSSFSHPLQFKLNLPPEDAAAVIRDQTRSSFLEEIIHPWKESLYVNGFVPTHPRDEIKVDGVIYANKVTVRLVPSHPVTRLTVLGITAVCMYFIFREYV